MRLPGLINKGDNLTEWSRSLESYLRSITPKSSGSIRVSCGGGGATFAVDKEKAPQQSYLEDPKPFQVLSSGQNLGINPLSTLFKNLKGEKCAITGLLTQLSDGTISPSDPGWFACPQIGQKIWLQIGTSDPAHPDAGPQLWPATTAIRSGAVGGSLWDEYPDPISVDGSPAYQEFYNLLLAEVTDPATDPRPAILTVTIGTGDSAESRQITQCWNTHVLMPFLVVINGLLCLVPLSPPSQAP